MVTRDRPTQSLIRATVAGPNLSTVPNPAPSPRRGRRRCRGRGRSVGSEVQVELGLAAGGAAWAGSAGELAPQHGCAGRGSLPVGDHPDRLGLADVEGVGVAQRLQLGGLVTDQVVKAGQVQGVAGDVEMGGAGPLSVVAVVETDPPRGLALLLPGLQQVRVMAGDGLGDRGLDRPPPTRPDPVRQLAVDIAAPAMDRVWVAWAILRAFHGATTSASTAAQMRGSRWVRSRASANSCSPDIVETPRAAANGSGVNAATNGVPSPPRASSSGHRPGQTGVGPGHEPGLGGGRVQHTPPGRGPQLGSAGLTFPDLGFGGEVEDPLRVEVTDLDRVAVQHRLQHESIQPAATDIPAPESGPKRRLGRSIFESFLNPAWVAVGEPPGALPGVADTARFHSRRWRSFV